MRRLRAVLCVLPLAFLAFFAAHTVALAADVTIFVSSTASTSWTVPSDWNSASNTIEVIGGGGGGNKGSGTANSGGGGGGGAYAKIANFSASGGATVTIQVGGGGAANATGTDSWFNGASCAAASACAKGGSPGIAGGAGGGGGPSSTSVGSTTFAGGIGGTQGGTNASGGGGGGAGGPNGRGNYTAASTTTSGASGDNGSGGSGGSPGNPGGTGNKGAEWATNYGSGGGGGGANVSAGTGGTGGLYGGGGGGGGRSTGAGGPGAQGIIVITYTPVQDVTAPTPNPMTWSSVPAATGTSTIAMTASTASDASTPVQYRFTYNAGCAADNGSSGSSSTWQVSTSYTDAGLQANKCYAFTVQAEDAASSPNVTSPSALGSAYTFANIPGAPTVGSPSTSTLTISNSSSSNPVNTLFAAQVTSTSPTDGAWSGQWIDSTGSSSSVPVWLTNAQLTNLVVKGLQSSTTYTFTVKAENGDSLATAQGATVQGTTNAISPPGAPGTPSYSSVSTSTLTVSWSSATNASYYKIERATSSQTYAQISTTSATSYNDSGLTPSTAYYYRIRATNVAGDGSYSATSTTTTAANNSAPNAPSLGSPTNAATNVSITPTFTMTGTDPDGDNLQYKVTIYSVGGCSSVVQTNDESSSQTGWSGQNASTSREYTSGTQGSFTVQSALANSTTYYWRASAKDPEGSNGWTDSASCNSFTTVSAGGGGGGGSTTRTVISSTTITVTPGGTVSF